MPCPNCDDPNCSGEVDKLRCFVDWQDLSSHTSEELIVAWVNQLAESKMKLRDWGKRYRAKQQAFTKVAKRLLDPDELERLQASVEEQLNHVHKR